MTRLLPILVLLPLVAGCGGDSVNPEFEAAFPPPAWWDEVSVRGVEVVTVDDLLDYWQDDDRSESQFFKAAYLAVAAHPEDDDLVAAAIGLMPYVERSWPPMRGLLEYGVERFFHYDRPLQRYSGYSGDTTAGMVWKLAEIHRLEGRPLEGSELVRRLVEAREEEINDHLLERLTLIRAAALADQGLRDEATGILEDAIARYEGSWEELLRELLTDIRTRS